MKKIKRYNKKWMLWRDIHDLQKRSSLAVAWLIRILRNWSTEVFRMAIVITNSNATAFQSTEGKELGILVRCPQTIPGREQHILKTVIRSAHWRIEY